MTDLSILMPVFNEGPTVEAAIGRALDAEYPVEETELIVIDDGSTDGSNEVLNSGRRDGRVHILRHPVNRGKGAAVRTGLTAAAGTYTTILDADLEYRPDEIGKVITPLLQDGPKAVFGVRGFESHSAFSFWYVVGNKAVTLGANLLFNSWLSDIMTCHKAMRTELFRSLDLREDGFGIEAEITARLLLAGVKIFEVPITYEARTREEGKKLTAVDGLRVLTTLIRSRWR